MMARLTLRNLGAHRLRLLFTAVAVVLGVSFVAGTMIFRDTAARSFDTAFADRDIAQEVSVQRKQTFTGEDAPPRLVPETVLGTLREKVPGAEGFFGSVEGYAAIIGPSGTVVGGENTAHRGRAYVERPGPSSKMRITTGRAPTADRDLVVEEHTAAEGAITVGAEVNVVTRAGQQKMDVVGIFTLGEDRIGDVVTYVGFSPSVAEKLLTGPGQYSAIWIRPRPGVSQDQLAAQITAAVPADYEVTTAQKLVQQAKEQIKSFFGLLGTFLLAFAAVSVLIGTFIIFNTFTMLVAQRTRELALLRAIGASRAQVTRAVVGEAIGVGLLGSTIGIFVGAGVAVVLKMLFERFGTPLPAGPLVIEPATVLWSYAVGVIVTVVAAYLPARRAAKIPPVAALRDDNVVLPTRTRVIRLVLGLLLTTVGGVAMALSFAVRGEGAEGATGLLVVSGVSMFIAAILLGPVLSKPVIAVIGWPITRLGGLTGRLSRENARRDPRRSAATASALMIGLALVSLATVVASSLSASADKRLDREFGADYAMDPRGLAGFSKEAVDRVAAVAGVRSVAVVQYGTVKIDNQETSITVADPAGLVVPVNLRIEEGAGTVGADEMLVERTIADERKWRVGTTVPGLYPDQSPATFKVVGIFADNEVVTRPYIMSPAGYQPHATGDLVQRAFVDLDDGNLSQARQGVQTALQAYPGIQLKDRQDAKEDAREDIDQALNAILALLVLSIAIAAVGIINTLGLSVVERTREIGLLRAVGMGRRQIRSMVRYESVVIALFGATLGLALGVGLAVAVQHVLSANGMEVLDISPGRLGIYLLSAVLIGIVAAIWPAWRAARMNILDAIHHQ